MPTAGIGNPSSALVAGNKSQNPILQDYVFNDGLIQPEHSSWLLDLYPMYRLTSLMDKIGGFSPIKNDVMSWSKLGRTRESATITSGVSGLPAASLNLVLSTSYTATTNLGYFLVNDVVRTESGKLLKVTAIGNSGAFQQITVANYDGSNIVTGDIANAESIGHAWNAFGAGSTGPVGRLYLPDEEYNYTQIFRRGNKIDRGAFSNRIYLKEFGILGAAGESWMFHNEQIDIAENLRDIENAIMFGTRSSSGGTKTTRGIWDRVVTAGEGQVVNYTTATGISESDLQTLITRLKRQGGSNELLVLCGSEAMMDIQQALKQYTVNGAVSFGSFGGNTVGLDITQYKFGGFTLNFTYYPLFDDDKFLPFVSTSTSTKVNFRQVALALDLGTPGQRLLELKYRDGDIGPAKFVHQYIDGMFSVNGGRPANSFDGIEYQLLSELMVVFRGPNRSGALISNA